jgi:choline dehydrogenase
MLGGSSSMNAMIYMRGNRLDYDGWDAQGASGWSYDDVLPYFIRSEHNEQIRNEFHGQNGPLNVTKIRKLNGVSEALIEAAAAVGVERTDDYNGVSQDGTGQFQVTHRKGMRWSSAEAYLRPARGRKNFDIETNALVSRIVIENGRTVAVEVLVGNSIKRIGVTGEVIVSGGAFNTPALLQLSGIGPADHLRSVGIEPLIDLPAVGANLMEHPLISVTGELADGSIGLMDAEEPKYLAQWAMTRRGKLASNVAEAGAHIRTDSSMPAPNFQIVLGPVYFCENGAQKWDVPAFTLALSQIAPVSRGAVRVRSTDPSIKPDVQLNMYSEQSEVDEMVDAIEFAREIIAAAPFRTKAGAEIQPGARMTDRAELAAWVRGNVQHTYHPACTARIGSPEDGAVDNQLRVHGVEGLRVADTSVMPTVIRGNTHAPAVMIGERCADFVRGRALPDAPVATEATTARAS